MIHNMSESQEADMNMADAQSVAKLMSEGLNMDGVESTRTIRLHVVYAP